MVPLMNNVYIPYLVLIFASLQNLHLIFVGLFMTKMGVSIEKGGYRWCLKVVRMNYDPPSFSRVISPWPGKTITRSSVYSSAVTLQV